jgi:hypothetical protein
MIIWKETFSEAEKKPALCSGSAAYGPRAEGMILKSIFVRFNQVPQ